MLEKIIAKETVENAVNNVVNNAVEDAAYEVKGIFNQLAGNYIKRRNVGFSIWNCIKGSWKETTNSVSAKLCGREYTSTKEAIIFDDRL